MAHLPAHILPLQRLVVQRAEQLPTRALVAAARMPRLQQVLLREGEVRDERDEGPEVRGGAVVSGGVFEAGEDLLERVGGHEADDGNPHLEGDVDYEVEGV